jgi:hypothetical protein
MSEHIPSKKRSLEDAERSSAFWKAETIAGNSYIRELRQLLDEARAYVQSFASITKHPTAPADAMNLAQRIVTALNRNEATAHETPAALRSTEGTCTCLPKLDPRGCNAPTCPVAEAIRRVPAYRCGSCGADLSTHPTSASAHICAPSKACDGPTEREKLEMGVLPDTRDHESR